MAVEEYDVTWLQEQIYQLQDTLVETNLNINALMLVIDNLRQEFTSFTTVTQCNTDSHVYLCKNKN